MALTIFFSWQSDAPPIVGRNLIERALRKAIQKIAADLSIEEAVRDLEIDRDTMGVPGSPPIMETIFRKIDQAAIFIADVTFVGMRDTNRPTPNPNVLIEYGWALKSLTHFQIISVMNVAFGTPTRESMPFDLGSFRYPITYECAAASTEEERSKAKDALSRALELAIRNILGSTEFRNKLPKPSILPEFTARAAVDGPARFKLRNEPIGVSADSIREAREIFLADKPATWFRMMPSRALNESWSPDRLQRVATEGPLLSPITNNWQGYSFIRSHEGFGIYSVDGSQRNLAEAAVFVFTTGEIWTIDAYTLGATKQENLIPPLESEFRRTMASYGNFMSDKLGIEPPFKWTAGMDGLKGRGLYIPPPPNRTSWQRSPAGKCQLDTIEGAGSYSPGESTAECLKPFFTKLYDSCGLSRPEWLDK
jgi:hypothetical protein